MNNNSKPEWMNNAVPSIVLDARPMLANGQHPLQQVLDSLEQMNPEQILLLITPFKPQPLHDKVIQAGCTVWTENISMNEIHSYIRK